MHRMLAELRVVLLELQPIGRITTILRRRVARRAGRFGALQNHLVAYILSFCHDNRSRFSVSARPGVLDAHALATRFIQHRLNSVLVDRLERLGRYAQRDPAVLLGNVKPLLVKVQIEAALRLIVCVGNVVSRYRSAARKIVFA